MRYLNKIICLFVGHEEGRRIKNFNIDSLSLNMSTIKVDISPEFSVNGKILDSNLVCLRCGKNLKENKEVKSKDE